MHTWTHMPSVLIFMWCENGAGPKVLMSLQAPPKTHPLNMPCPCFGEFSDGCTCFHVSADTIMWVREGSFLYWSTKLILKLNNKLSLNLNRYMYFYVCTNMHGNLRSPLPPPLLGAACFGPLCTHPYTHTHTRLSKTLHTCTCMYMCHCLLNLLLMEV